MKLPRGTLLAATIAVTGASPTGWSLMHQSFAAPANPAPTKSTPSGAADSSASDSAVIPSVTQRFAAKSDEVPNFQKHVVPLLGRLGCNGRACHGSFKGQGDFRLSLFGYDFKNDHEQITNKEKSRVDVESPELSMFLMKPTLEDQHGGGKRMDLGSWQYHLLHRWVEAGAKGLEGESTKLTKLEITPSELLFHEEGMKSQLKAVAIWADGTREDVTALCRFQTNNPAVAEITETGLVTAADNTGDTHVVVFYDGGVVPIPVLRPVSDKTGPNYPTVATRTKIDELVVNKLKKLGVVPSAVCSDEEFLRRVSLDLIGALPLASEVEAFLKDSSPDKRSRKIDELLASPSYAALWTTRLCDWTGNNPDFANIETGRDRVAQDWYDWIYKRIAENRPYDEICAGLVTAVSREPDESFDDYCAAMSDVYRKDAKTEFADRSSMPLYWVRSNFRTTEERAIGFAYTFMGVRIQCAQCHKHPFDQWTQDDFQKFEAFFSRVNYNINPEDRDQYNALLKKVSGDSKKTGNQLRQELGKMLASGQLVPLREVYVVPPRQTANRSRDKDKKANSKRVDPKAEGRVLGGQTIDLNDYADAREPLMDWLRSDENPYFAKAFANRVWANYFNVGIVNPPDDLNLANPPSNAPLLNYLADGFRSHNFDMKWLHREILNSDTYQRSWKPNETNAGDESNFSRSVHRRLPAEAAYDALVMATVSDERAKELLANPSERAIGIAGAGRRNRTGDAGYALTVFGRNTRESNCDCDRSNEASLLQTVYLQNDTDILKMLDGRGTWVGQIAGATGQAVGADASDRNDKAASRLKEEMNEIKEAREKLEQLGRKFAELRRSGKQKEAAQLASQATKLRSQLASREQAARKLAQSVRANSPEPVRSTEKPSNASNDVAEIVEQAYLRSLSRYPTADEMQTAVGFVKQSPAIADGARDLLWALINTKEFIVNH